MKIISHFFFLDHNKQTIDNSNKLCKNKRSIKLSRKVEINIPVKKIIKQLNSLKIELVFLNQKNVLGSKICDNIVISYNQEKSF